MLSRGRLAILVALTASLLAGSAGATSYVPEGDAALAPLSHVQFCMTNPEDCRQTSEDHALVGADSLRHLDEVNRSVNAAIRPRSRNELVARWRVQPVAGDCNDYAVTKRHLLIQRGVPASALRLAVVDSRWGGHLVLVARTASGDLVLDNLSGRIRAWTETGHSFVKVQSSDDPREWKTVNGRATNVAAIEAKRQRQARLAALGPVWDLVSPPAVSAQRDASLAAPSEAPATPQVTAGRMPLGPQMSEAS